MQLRNFLYLVQLEEYDINRIKAWLLINPNREVVEIKNKLVWTVKIKVLYVFAKTLFFLPPVSAIFVGLTLLGPFDKFTKHLIILGSTLKLRLFHRHLRVIGITGSWGKTTTKEVIKHIIEKKYVTKSTEGNINTTLGISKTVVNLPINTQIFICEMGAYRPGEIRTDCEMVKPSIGIITAIGPMHLERFGSMENIVNAKMELAQAIPINGRLYLPVSLKAIVPKYNLKVQQIVFFNHIEEVYQDLGRYLGINKEVIGKALTEKITPTHRQEIIESGTMRIIDDTYNSNPKGFELALNKLKSIPSKNRILVTPGMIELGQLQQSENKRLAAIAGKICQSVVIVGQTNRQALLAGLKGTKAKTHQVKNLAEAQNLLTTITTPGAAILFENDLPDNYF